MWSESEIGEHAASLLSFIAGATYLVRDGASIKVCMGGMDVTGCSWMFEAAERKG